MSEKDPLHALYLLLEERVRDMEELVLKQAQLMTAQSETIIKQRERLDEFVAEYRKIRETTNILIADYNRDKEYDKRLDEVTDIVVSKQKYKM